MLASGLQIVQGNLVSSQLIILGFGGIVRHMSELRVSVVIAAFNGEEFLGRAIDSILSQSRQAFEIIVVDDGSSDGTKGVVTAYGDRVRYVYQKNAGVSAARNTGARSASGDWLIFLDVDDYYYKDRIRRHCDLVGQHPDIDFVVGNYDYCSPDGGIISDSMSMTELGRSARERCGAENTTLLVREEIGRLISEYFGHTLSIGVRRSMFMDLGGFPEGYRVGEDLHLLIRLCLKSRKVGVVCEPLGAYIVHDSGLVRSDTEFSQRETVRTLLNLRKYPGCASSTAWKYYLKVLQDARYDWALSLLRKGRRGEAVSVMLPSIYETPGWASLRSLLSILKG